MNWPPLYFLIFVAAAISTALAVYAWLHRSKPSVTTFALLMLAAAAWSLASGFRELSATPESTHFWFNAAFLGVATVPAAYLVFVLQYTGREKWLSPFRLGLLFVVPAVTQVIVWTNGAHGLFFHNLDFSQEGSLLGGAAIPGPWFVVHTIYSYALLLWGIVLILLTILRSHHLYRRQALVLLLATIPAAGLNVLRSFGLIPALHSTVEPFGFTLAGVVLAWDLFRYQLLDVVPVARDVLIDSLGDGMLVLDVQNRVVDLNPAMQTILGLQARQAIGQPLEVVLQHRQDWLEHPGESRKDHGEITAMVEGVPHYYDLQVSPLADRQGRPTGRLIVLREVTRRKEVEQALLRSNLELQARNEELDAFVRTVAHDLKTPLAGVIGYAELVEEDLGEQPTESLREDVHHIIQSGRKMSTIIDELLLMASVRKIEEVELEPLDMASILREVRKRLSSLIKEYQAEIIVADEWPVALGRSLWVEEIWANYVSNAIKYGGQPPRVELGAAAQEDGVVRFWVRDNGAGLSAEEQEKLFIPFTRLQRMRTEGHGLGLSIVQQIAEKMGGQVAVESAGLPGQGCTFSFTLPAW